MASKIDKTIERLRAKINEGQYYEAHQQLRVVSARYVKQENWSAAADIVFSGAQSLLKAGQGGSGGDLSLLLVDIYEKSGTAPDQTNKGRIISLLREFKEDEPSRKRFISEVIGWSSKYGEFPAGDPELHHVIGTIFAQERDVYEAERHLILGTRESPECLVRLEYEWYSEDDSHTAGLYAARSVLPYLLIGNLRDAVRSLQLFTGRLSEANKNLGVQDVSTNNLDVRLYPSLPLLNFLNLLLLAIQKGSKDLFRQLTTHYSDHLRETASWNDAIEQIGEMYFGIPIHRQTNPLFDMMGSLFGGGGGPPPPKSRRIEPPSAAAPPAMDLD